VKEKVVIITGATSGIGLSTAKVFGRAGSVIVLAARSKEKLNILEHEFRKMGVRVLAVPTDVRKEEDCRNLIRLAVKEFGHINILINNAGISMRAVFGDLQLEVFRTIMQTNFWGTVYCTKYALPHLLESGGTVVGVSSFAGFQGLPGRTAYSASKFALQAFLETLRMEYQREGLHVFIIAPGFTNTNIRKVALTAIGKPQGTSPRIEIKMMSSDQVARRIFNGVKHHRRFMVLTFIGKFTFLMRKISPRLMDRVTTYFMSREPGSPF